MKNFIRSIPGKVILFVIMNISIAVCLAGALGSILMIDRDLYTYDDFVKIVPVCIICIFVTILGFVTMLCVAGHRPGTDEVFPGAFHKVPFDLILAAFCAFTVIGVLFTDMFNFPEILPAIAVLCFLCGNFFFGLSMSAATRIKLGTLVKGSVCYWCLRLVWRIVKGIFGLLKAFLKASVNLIRSIPLVWKTALALAVIIIAELLVLGMDYDLRSVLYVFEKLVITAVVLLIAVNLRKLEKGGEAIAAGDFDYRIDTKHLFGVYKRHGENLNSISSGMSSAVNQKLKSERMKTELITNVSHDIKTPLTSIINYSALISQENTDNERIAEYSEVLQRQSKKLKRLLDDLVEASKASTGNLDVQLAVCDAGVFISQAEGEYQDKMQEAGLTLISKPLGKEIRIMADSRRMWRVFDNLMNNICKYSQPGSRVYLSLEEQAGRALITFRNISRDELNISVDELMERFVRGDSARNTEGNGLGLSIARSLTELQNGTFALDVDGDLFKVTLSFPVIE